LRHHKEVAIKVIVFGQLQGKNLGLQTLKSWAYQNLHKSLTSFALIGNGFFEATFTKEQGSTYALNNSFTFEGKEIIFFTWDPCFSSSKTKTITLLHYLIWVKFLGINYYFKNEECLSILANKLG